MDFAGDKIQPFLQPYPLPAADGRGQRAFGFQVGQELDDHRAFGQHLAVVQLQRGNVSLAVDRTEVAAIGGLPGRVVDLDQFEREAELAQHDMRRQRAAGLLPAMMNLAHWRLLVAVADEGTISRGADRVGISQSGASQALAQLEASLGFAVFVRERRQVEITALGRRVIEHARSMLGGLQAIRALADDSRGVSGVRIRLASFPSIISGVLPPLYRRGGRALAGIRQGRWRGGDEPRC
ncbi:hypothetical protein G6F57_017001 [Rhizopus arrhizus]|nr:hypothetical protein G6F57_017001 [Rhizopus arrhizus]